MSPFFLGESKNGFLISGYTDSSLPRKRTIRKRIIYHATACPGAPRGKKKTDPLGEDKTKKQHKLRMSIRNGYIFWFETQTFLE